MLSASSPEIRAFVAAFEENQNAAGHPIGVVASDRSKYIAIDEIDKGATPPYVHRGGRFLIDRGDGMVYSIKGYGKRGYAIGEATHLTERYRAGTASLPPGHRAGHVEHGRGHVASAFGATTRSDLRSAALKTAHDSGHELPYERKPRLSVLQGGLSRFKLFRRSRRIRYAGR